MAKNRCVVCANMPSPHTGPGNHEGGGASLEATLSFIMYVFGSIRQTGQTYMPGHT